MVTQDRAIATRKNVLLAAANVFERKGFAAATIAQILEEADVTKGSLYFHFDSKEALAKAIISEQTDWRESNVDDGGAALEQMIALSHSFATALIEDPLVRASIRLTVERTGLQQGEAEAYQGWVSAVTALLHQADQEGELRPEVDIEAAAYLLASAVTGIQLFSEALSGRKDLHSRVNDLWRIILPALAKVHVCERINHPRSLVG